MDVAAPRVVAAPQRTAALGWRRLFTAPPGPRVGLPWIAGLVVAGGAVGLLRHAGGAALDTVWAEDGQVFLADAAAKSPAQALTSSYAGYFHLVPRLIAEMAVAVPAPWAAAALAISAALVTSLLAAAVYTAAGTHLTSVTARLLIAAPVVIAPLAQQDVPNSIANLHWPLLYAVFWMLIWSPRTGAGRTVAVAVVAATAFSDILVLAYLPLALLAAAVARTRHRVVLASVLTAGVVVQLAGLVAGSGTRETSIQPVKAVTGYALRAVPSALLGEAWAPDGPIDGRRVVVAGLAWLLIAAAAVLTLRTRPRPLLPLAATAFTQSAALYALPLVLTGVATPRYAFAPALLLVTALTAVLLPPPGAGWPSMRSLPFIAYALLCVTVWTVNLPAGAERLDGPRWRAEVDRARSACVATEGVVSVSIPIGPQGWSAEMPCTWIEEGR